MTTIRTTPPPSSARPSPQPAGTSSGWVSERLGISLSTAEAGALQALADHAQSKLSDPTAIDTFVRGATTSIIEPSGSAARDALRALGPGAAQRMRALIGQSVAPFIPPEVAEHKSAIVGAFVTGFIAGAAKTPGDAKLRLVGGLISGLRAALAKIGEVMDAKRSGGDEFKTGSLQPATPEVVSSTRPATRGSPMLTMIRNRTG